MNQWKYYFILQNIFFWILFFLIFFNFFFYPRIIIDDTSSIFNSQLVFIAPIIFYFLNYFCLIFQILYNKKEYDSFNFLERKKFDLKNNVGIRFFFEYLIIFSNLEKIHLNFFVFIFTIFSYFLFLYLVHDFLNLFFMILKLLSIFLFYYFVLVYGLLWIFSPKLTLLELFEKKIGLDIIRLKNEKIFLLNYEKERREYFLSSPTMNHFFLYPDTDIPDPLQPYLS